MIKILKISCIHEYKIIQCIFYGCGLKKDERIIIGPYDLVSKDLEDGDIVTIIDKKKLAEKEAKAKEEEE